MSTPALETIARETAQRLVSAWERELFTTQNQQTTVGHVTDLFTPFVPPALRQVAPQEPHPDSVRLDWLDMQGERKQAIIGSYWYWEVSGENDQIRVAIDEAIKSE